ncbi:uncharacterized protein LOC131845750 [Achroia grisella]|uniref:uncharacterized protein LOC131845750 n=1 Tax=Achroia grisella TaxID=688607 RepID=UPI0027D30877|nr:uncharacterized protein LOC131845750 [Achroia grisella]
MLSYCFVLTVRLEREGPAVAACVGLTISAASDVGRIDSETWTLRKTGKKKVDALEMWCWRQMLGISSTEFRTNYSILKDLCIRQRLSTTVQLRILTFFGHVSHRGNDSIERLVVQGKVEGTRPRGRSPMRWTDQIKAATKCSVYECTRKATVRDEWRRITKNLTHLDSKY